MIATPMVYDVAQEPPDGPDPAAARGRRAAMRTPRQLLVSIAIALVVIGWQTFRYPPGYLAFAPVWCAITVIAGLTCAAAAVHPRRIYVATSGATVVCSTSARALANFAEAIEQSHRSQASYIVLGGAWSLIAILSYVVWREYVLPWSLTREARHRR